MGIYVITEPCIDVKDASCVEVCPVACIHTTPDSPQYYIDPDVCIECGQCEVVCPVDAIFVLDDVPDHWQSFVEVNAEFFRANKPALEPVSRQLAEAIVEGVHRFAELHGATVATMVVDQDGILVYEASMDGASPAALETAAGRARMALAKRLGTDGGQLILEGVSIIGAIGVGGANTDLDNLCVQVGAALTDTSSVRP